MAIKQNRKYFIRSCLFVVIIVLHIACASNDNDSSDDENNFIIYGSGSQSENSSNPSFITKFIPSYSVTYGGSPTSTNMGFYSVYLSQNADCSEYSKVADYEDTPLNVDMIASPKLFSSSLNSGTYKCIIIKMSDIISFTADSTAVATHSSCVDTSTKYTFDLVRSGMALHDVDGNLVDAAGEWGNPIEGLIYLFFSTNKSEITVASSLQVFDLSTPIEITNENTTSITFYMDFSDRVNELETGGNYYCNLDSPSAMGIR